MRRFLVLLALLAAVQGIACPAAAAGEAPAVTPAPAVSEITLSVYTEDARKTLAFLDSCMEEADCYGSWARSMGGMGRYEKNWIVIMINLPAGNADSFLESVGREVEIRSLVRSTATPVPELPPGTTPSPTPVAVELHSRSNASGYLLTSHLSDAVHVTVNVHVICNAEEREKMQQQEKVMDFFESGKFKLVIALGLIIIGTIRALCSKRETE